MHREITIVFNMYDIYNGSELIIEISLNNQLATAVNNRQFKVVTSVSFNFSKQKFQCRAFGICFIAEIPAFVCL